MHCVYLFVEGPFVALPWRCPVVDEVIGFIVRIRHNGSKFGRLVEVNVLALFQSKNTAHSGDHFGWTSSISSSSICHLEASVIQYWGFHSQNLGFPKKEQQSQQCI